MVVYGREKVQEYQQQEKAGIITAGSGLAMIAAVLVMQYLSVSSLSAGDTIALSEEQSTAFSGAALSTFGIVVVAIAISLVGMRRVLGSWRSADVGGRKIIHRVKKSVALALQKYRMAFWLALSLYFVVFLFASNTIVYSTERISERYGVSVPSYHIIGCCGQPGSFPVLTVYLSEHVGLLLIPANIMLLSYLPILVAVNAAVLFDKLRLSRGSTGRAGFGKNVSFCGISVGVLAGCPTCAGSIILPLIAGGGSAAGLAAATVMTGYQPIFMVGSIAALIAAPLIMELS